MRRTTHGENDSVAQREGMSEPVGTGPLEAARAAQPRAQGAGIRLGIRSKLFGVSMVYLVGLYVALLVGA